MKQGSPEDLSTLKVYLTQALLFMDHFKWISNSYVAEFFTQQLWMKFPESWKVCLEKCSLEQIAKNILHGDHSVWPLSLLSFVEACHALALDRKQHIDYLKTEELPKQLSYTFKKHTKPKKQHELSLLPKLIHRVCERNNVNKIVDVGSGLGHLARVLAYRYGYHVTAVERSSQQLPAARKYDKQIEEELKRHFRKDEDNEHEHGTVNHIAKEIHPNISSEEFRSLFQNDGLRNEDQRCILIGLHTCGDLASTMLRVFHNTPEIIAIVSVSCCYFRMTLKSEIDNTTSTEDLSSSIHSKELSVKNSVDHTQNNTDSMVEDSDNIEKTHSCSKDYLGKKASFTLSNLYKQYQTINKCFGCLYAQNVQPDYEYKKSIQPISCKETSPESVCTCNGDMKGMQRRIESLNFCQSENTRLSNSDGCRIGKTSEMILNASPKHEINQKSNIFNKVIKNQITLDKDNMQCPDLVAEYSAKSQSHYNEDCSEAYSMVRAYQYGFPLSTFLNNQSCQPLKYKSLETACHFLDDYVQKLLENSPNLKLHCYRAVMEAFIRHVDPSLVLASVRCKKIKNASSMSFEEYAMKVFQRLNMNFKKERLLEIDYQSLLEQTKNVTMLHSLALLLGPVIESIVLVDKQVFLMESGFHASLIPVFDPKLSPRNFVIVAEKNEEPSIEKKQQ